MVFGQLGMTGEEAIPQQPASSASSPSLGLVPIMADRPAEEGESQVQVEDGEARGRILRDLGFAALAAALGLAIAVSLQVGFRRFDSTFIILTAWGIPAILMYGLLTWTRRNNPVLRVARPVGVTLGWTLAWLLSSSGALASLGTSLFTPILYMVAAGLLFGIPMWLSILLTEWVVRALLHLH